MTALRDVPADVLARAARIPRDPPAPDLAEILRSNLEANLADPDRFEEKRDAFEDAVEPLPALGYPVELPPLRPDGATGPKR
jgi:hypothetical protein